MTANARTANDQSTTDRIEKKVELRAARSRVWRALASTEEFNAWFRVRLDGEFAEGKTLRGNLTHPGYEHVTMEMTIERIEPERYFAWRWHPYAIDPATDYSAEPTTLVEFTLEDSGGGTVLTIVESGFDRIPLDRRDEAFRMNDRGWDGQSRNLVAYVE